MAKIVDWEKAIEKLSEKEKEKIIDSIKTLMAWNFLKKEFEWTGLKTIKKLIELIGQSEL